MTIFERNCERMGLLHLVIISLPEALYSEKIGSKGSATGLRKVATVLGRDRTTQPRLPIRYQTVTQTKR